jgi:2-polyprenyl-3-methyl-5-hydroxy-6-metoxy-1,4-benzoquinol methylase
MAFDQAYYQRYYFDPKTAVNSNREVRARATLIAAYVEHIGLPVGRILDMGCGTGGLKARLLKLLPRATYTGVEVSEYLCKRYGWEQSGVEDYKSKTPFDLVVCYDVVQYLDDQAATRAINNLTRLCRGVLYFTALTRADWDENCDQRRTDRNVNLRPGEWYRKRLRRGFREIGAGFWLRRGSPLTVWDLESALDKPVR